MPAGNITIQVNPIEWPNRQDKVYIYFFSHSFHLEAAYLNTWVWVANKD